jgi:predicted transcriptional regulator
MRTFTSAFSDDTFKKLDEVAKKAYITKSKLVFISVKYFLAQVDKYGLEFIENQKG